MPPRSGPIDYDLHGLVGVRLIDALPSDARAVARQLGPFRRDLAREPDLVIRFVDRLAPDANLRLLGVHEAGHTDDTFLVLRSRYGAQARVRIPFLELGGRCEIVCESGLPAVPLLIASINWTALARGVAPLHASAFSFEGRGVLVTGWSKGGKTEALMAFAEHGAEYVGDEWIYLEPASGRMYGLPQPIRLWDWHLAQLPAVRSRVSRAQRWRLDTIAAGLGAGDTLARLAPRTSAAARTYQRAREAIRRQAHVDADPESLFGTLGTLSADLDRVFLLASHQSSAVTVEPIDPRILAQRMVYSVHYEFATFMSYYDMYRFAFPGTSNPLVEALEDRLGHLLARALDSKPALAVYHPYPVRIADLFQAIRPHL